MESKREIKFYIIKNKESESTRLSLEIIKKIKAHYYVNIEIENISLIDKIIEAKPHVLFFDNVPLKRITTSLTNKIHSSKSNTIIIWSTESVDPIIETKAFDKNIDYVFNKNNDNTYFVSRLKSILRRYSEKYQINSVIEFKNLIIDQINKTAHLGKKEISFTNMEFKFLRELISGEKIIRKEVLKKLWNADEDTTRIISQYIHRINKKLSGEFKIMKTEDKKLILIKLN